MGSGRRTWRRRGFLRLGLAALAAAAAARLLPRRGAGTGAPAEAAPPGREARHWKRA